MTSAPAKILSRLRPPFSVPWPLATVLAIVTLYHVTLLGRGALAFPDEYMSFRSSLQIVDALSKGDLRGAAAGTIGFWGARPAEFLLRAPAAALQRLAERWTSLPPTSPASLPLATAQNVPVSLGLSIIFFHVTRRLLGNESIAQLAGAAFALLATNHIWVRHLLPYDAALAVHLAAVGLYLNARIPEAATGPQLKSAILWCAPAVFTSALYPVVFYRVRELGLPWAMLILTCWVFFAGRLSSLLPRAVWRSALIAGAVSALALTFYPAYYSFTIAVGLMFAVTGSPTRPLSAGLKTVLPTATYASGVLSVVFAFEVIARIGGLSYLGAARLMPQTINQGTYEEGFIFLPRYLLATDGVSAVFLVGAAMAGFLVLIWRWSRGTLVPAEIPLLRVTFTLLALYLAYGFQSTVLHRMNFTGRYVRMYIPFVVWLAAIALACCPPRARRWIAVAWIGAALTGFVAFWGAYRIAEYPADALYEFGINFDHVVPHQRVYETEIVPSYNLPVAGLTAGSPYQTRPDDRRFVLVNFGWFDLDGTSFTPFEPEPHQRLVMNRPHFQCAVSSRFEGFSERRRADCEKHDFRLKVYRQD